jgi:hypothetical protein
MIYKEKKIKKIRGDASFRLFFRKKDKKIQSILIYAKKEKKKNLLIYDSINKLLLKNNILAPKLYTENYKKNFIEVEDFGDETIHKKLIKDKKNIFHEYKKIINLLNKIQKIKETNIKNFQKKNYKIPIYTKNLLTAETNLFFRWYAPTILKKKNLKSSNIKIKKILRLLYQKIKQPNNVFVHRDFHVSNLMNFKNKIAVIDSQDAVIGNRAYDLASLIDDVRLKTSENLKELIYQEYIKFNKKKINYKDFRNDFEILSVLRNLKIIGIFSRLALRDGKTKYLNLIPYTWKLIEMRICNNIIFKDLKKYLNFYYSFKQKGKNAN